MALNQSATIERVSIHEIEIPYAVPFQISGGVSYSRKSLIIKMQGEGLTAYGESAPFEQPFYSSETIGSARLILEQLLIPRVVGKRFDSIEQLNDTLGEGIRGNAFAKAGIETAYWDLVARKNDVPIKTLIHEKLAELGTSAEYLQSKEYIESGVSVGIPEDGKLFTLGKWIEDYAAHGYTRIKVKIKPGWDLDVLRTARDVIGNDFPLWPDANASFDLNEHLRTLRGIDEFNCLFFEQPLHHDDVYDHNTLSKLIETPICLDESLKSQKIAKICHELGFCNIWNIKVQRVGGLLEACKIYAYASQCGAKVWGGTMPESGIGAVSISSLATFAGFAYAADIEESARWYGPGHDIVEITMDEKGRIYLPDGPGIGAVSDQKLAELTV